MPISPRLDRQTVLHDKPNPLGTPTRQNPARQAPARDAETSLRAHPDASANSRSPAAPPVRVLVVGQTPPPHHGQAVMIQRLLECKSPNLRLFHVRTAFSRSIPDLGRVRPAKIWHLLVVILKIYYTRLVHRTPILYYPPSGPNLVPVLKDILILLSTRWLFRATILHIHAGGTSHVYPRLNPWLRPLFRWAFHHATAVIRLSEATPQDGLALRAQQEFLVPNGIPDAWQQWRQRTANQHSDPPDEPLSEQPLPQAEANPKTPAANCPPPAPPAPGPLAPDPLAPGPLAPGPPKPLRLLYVGALQESKGVLDLIEVCGQLAARHQPFELELVGQFPSDDFRRRVEHRIDQLQLGSRIRLPGVLVGDAKLERFANADVFCFPSYYECEAFPLVLLEAACFSLPVVATRWRGIPSIVREGQTGLLVEPHDVQGFADRLLELSDSSRRTHMGRLARQRFLQHYTLDQFLTRMEHIFLDLGPPT